MEKEVCWRWTDTVKQGSATFPKRRASNSVVQARAVGRKPHLLWTQTMKQSPLVRPLTPCLMCAEMASEIYLKCKIYTCPLLLLKLWVLLAIQAHCKLQDTVLSIQDLGMATYTHNASTWEAEAEGSKVQDLPGLPTMTVKINKHENDRIKSCLYK